MPLFHLVYSNICCCPTFTSLILSLAKYEPRTHSRSQLQGHKLKVPLLKDITLEPVGKCLLTFLNHLLGLDWGLRIFCFEGAWGQKHKLRAKFPFELKMTMQLGCAFYSTHVHESSWQHVLRVTIDLHALERFQICLQLPLSVRMSCWKTHEQGL